MSWANGDPDSPGLIGSVAPVKVATLPFRWLLPLKQLWLRSVLGVQGLMQLLMKERNGERWTPEDRLLIRRHLRALGELVPLLALFALPGGSLFLPLLAWFLDRRQAKARPVASRET